MESTDNNNAYASSGQGTAALTLGIIGTGLYLLQNGGLGNVLGGGNNREPPVSQRELDTRLACERQLTEKDMRIGQLEAEKYSDKGDLDTERRFDDKLAELQREIAGLSQANAFLRERTDLFMRMTGVIINGPTIMSSEAAASAYKTAGATPAAAGSGGSGN